MPTLEGIRPEQVNPEAGKLDGVKTDNWKHRSQGMRCKTCMFFVEKVSGPGTANSEVNVFQILGRCRRHAPTMSGWPVMYGTDWCGDHKIDEEKV